LLDEENFNGDMIRIAIWGITVSIFTCFFAVMLSQYFLFREEFPFPSVTGAAHLLNQIHKSDQDKLEKDNVESVARLEKGDLKPSVQEKIPSQKILPICLGTFIHLPH
jgi:uncharacterized oligopeptide transporter (OPT) family protein